MASANIAKELECPVCLSIYTDAVMLRCGHNFCRVCIDRVLGTQEGSGRYSCPECREKFQERPALQRKRKLCNIVENFLSAQPGQEESGVLCTYCIHAPVPAVKSCQLCEASLCDNHLRVHSKSPEHVLSDLTTSLKNRKCSIHKKILEYYCTEDSACICLSCCLIGEHKGHQMESLEEASEKRKEKLKNVLLKLMTDKEGTEEKVNILREHERKVQQQTASETERVITLFIELRRREEFQERPALQRNITLCNIVENFLSAQPGQEESGVLCTYCIHAPIYGKMRHIEELCNMTDPLTVLQDLNMGDICHTEDEENEDTDNKNTADEDTDEEDDDVIKKGDNEDRERYSELLYDGRDLNLFRISKTLHKSLCDIFAYVHRVFYIRDIVLDVNTACSKLCISDDRKTASWSCNSQKYLETLERFQVCPQVMSSQSFSKGRHSWEVDVGGSEYWSVGMCYSSVDRSERHTQAGMNKKSWCLYRKHDEYFAAHDSKKIQLPANISTDRVRIKLDYEAGQISFSALCPQIQHFTTYTAKFTEPLHTVLNVWQGHVTLSGCILAFY
ncbi:E3 ubiquitin/ISG15 ligase TRIM25-like [Pyxicephalus adspersus]|uniref:E3 ubiquitin/ISG15 ligase TRIM25-like n=1 Tax=Pyxicephalus adspersus TaxID=30357 RepID=UPI003B5B0AAE